MPPKSKRGVARLTLCQSDESPRTRGKKSSACLDEAGAAPLMSRRQPARSDGTIAKNDSTTLSSILRRIAVENDFDIAHPDHKESGSMNTKSRHVDLIPHVAMESLA